MMYVYNYFFNIVYFITGVVYLLLFKSILDNFSCKKFSNRTNYIVIILIAILIFICSFKSSIILILTCIVFYKINYEQSILKCFFISLVYWFFVYIPIEYISLELAFNINYNYLTQDFHMNLDIVDIECMLIQNMFMLVIFQICNQRKKLQIIKNKYNKLTYIFIVIQILINILMVIVVFRIIAIDKTLEKFYLVILIIIPILMLISYMYIFYMMKKSIYSYKLDYENKIIKENVLKEYNYYLDINKEKDKVRSLYHDMKNHIICIRHLCEDKETDKALEYIDSMQSNIVNYNQLNQTFLTGNMILDSVLRVKKSICLEKNIEFFIDMDFSKNDFIDMVDVCTIFSNLIDNAIEACEKIKCLEVPKKITLKSKNIDEFCTVLIENSKVNEIKQRKNLFITNKKNSNMHGIGLSNVKQAVEKYFGEMIVDYSKNTFTVKIMIPYKK